MKRKQIKEQAASVAAKVLINIFGEDINDVTNEYAPATDGAIAWNEARKCYIYFNMFFGYIPDGYTDDNRPDGASIMINNSCQILTWNKIERKWIEKRNL